MNLDPSQIHTRAGQLMQELQEHIEEVKRENPQFDDPGIIFEGWTIQKIASLQILVEQLYAKVIEKR